MKLNLKSRDELRYLIEEKLVDVPEGQRIHLDKELLEQLLFETSVVELSDNDEMKGKKIVAKHLIWSGSFLSKIDLSEVSFDDVIWNVIYDEGVYFANDVINLYEKYDIKEINLSNTNAKIDFSKSFGRKYKNDWDVELMCCNFSNTNLSNNLIDYNFTAEKCNFSNTSLSVNFKNDCSIRFYTSILSGLDFSKCVVDETAFGEEYQRYVVFDCDLSNTGLRVKTSNIPSDIFSKYKKWLGLRDSLNIDDISEVEKKKINFEMNQLYIDTSGYRDSLEGMHYLGEVIAKGYLIGCYVNDKPIVSKEQRQVFSQEKLEEYEEYKNELFNSVNNDIEEQIRRMKR